MKQRHFYNTLLLAKRGENRHSFPAGENLHRENIFKGKCSKAMSYNCIYSLTQQQCRFQELILNKHCKKCAFKNYNNNKNDNNISIVRKQEAT